MLFKVIIKFIVITALTLTMLLPVYANNTEKIKDFVSEAAINLKNELNNIRNSNNEVIPLGMNMKNSAIRDILFGINGGLYMMNKIERLPMSFSEPQSIEIPVLLYHHITLSKGYGDSVMSLELFKEHLDTIKAAGYNTVSLKEIIDYVYYGAELPEKPILITFDDGYRSNYTLAYPELVKRDMKAVIFVIGWAVGEHMYKDSGKEMITHFSYPEAREMIRSGFIEVQSHTYDMHQSLSLETSENVRESVKPFEDESEEAYIEALKNDYLMFDYSLYNNTGFRTYAVAYPHGEFTEQSEAVFNGLGAFVTFSTDFSGRNVLVQGDTNTLRKLYRFTISEGISAEELIPMIEAVYSDK